MAEGDIRVWYLMRGTSPTESVFFIPMVMVEEDDPGLFGATLRGLENRVVAMGATADEAEHQAIELFKGMIDHAITTNAPLEPLIGSGVFMNRVPIPLQNARTFFDMFDKLAKGSTDRLIEPSTDDDAWRFAPVTPVPIETTV